VVLFWLLPVAGLFPPVLGLPSAVIVI
jgi:hypothetical protein